MAEAWRARLDAWKDFVVEVKEYRELDAERVLVLSHVIAHGKASGVASEKGRQGERASSTYAKAR